MCSDFYYDGEVFTHTCWLSGLKQNNHSNAEKIRVDLEWAVKFHCDDSEKKFYSMKFFGFLLLFLFFTLTEDHLCSWNLNFWKACGVLLLWAGTEGACPWGIIHYVLQCYACFRPSFKQWARAQPSLFPVFVHSKYGVKHSKWHIDSVANYGNIGSQQISHSCRASEM